MSKTTDKLRAIGVFNTWGLLKRFADTGQDVACVYYQPDGRACRGHKTAVLSPSHQTNPKAAWYDHGCMSFVGPKAESLPQAMAWATSRYGIKEWAVCPTDRSARVPKLVRERALLVLRKPLADAEEGK